MVTSDRAERPRSLTCPVCSNVNEYLRDECLKCGLPLAPIREALEAVRGRPPGADAASPPRAEPRQETEPAPPLPELPARAEDQPTATYVDSSRFLIRGMGDRADEIAARLFKQLANRSLEGLRLSLGKLVIKIDDQRSDSRDYYFAERVFPDDARATMAVRIAPSGTDLFVEWRHYTTPGTRMVFGSGAFWLVAIIVEVIFVYIGTQLYGIDRNRPADATWYSVGLGLLVAVLLGWWAGEKCRHKERLYGLIGFQTQDSTAFQLSVRAGLDEAIDLAGISKELIQELHDDDDKNRRVI